MKRRRSTRPDSATVVAIVFRRRARRCARDAVETLSQRRASGRSSSRSASIRRPRRERARWHDRHRRSGPALSEQRRGLVAAVEPAGDRVVARRGDRRASARTRRSGRPVVLDVEDRATVWALVPEIVDAMASVSDVRWARLTRWRDLFAQFFDMPEVRDRADVVRPLEITARMTVRRAAARRMAEARLPGGERLAVSIAGRRRRAAAVRRCNSGRRDASSLQLLPNGSCLETVVDLPGTEPVVAGGLRSATSDLAALLGEELRVRSRDRAFEDAVRGGGGADDQDGRFRRDRTRHDGAQPGAQHRVARLLGRGVESRAGVDRCVRRGTARPSASPAPRRSRRSSTRSSSRGGS